MKTTQEKRSESHRLSNVVGFDDAPFARRHRGRVPVVGAVFADLRFDGVVIGEVEKDGEDAARVLSQLVRCSRFADHIRLVLLQGITMAGFNVVDAAALHRALGLPVLVVARKPPDLASIQRALVAHIPKGDQKWRLIQALGPMERAGSVYVQRVGIGYPRALAVVRRFAVHSHIPEPLRAAHLIAGALVAGESRGNP